MDSKQKTFQSTDTTLVDIEDATPMMRQYLKIKRENPGVIILYRMGDFYEMFFEDALLSAKELEITLTARDAGKLGKVPMAGVPAKAVESYIPRLLEKGYKVSICEQTEDPAQAKGLVERNIVKTLTAGTITDAYLLKETKNNFLAAVYESTKKDHTRYGIAYADASTGEFKMTEVMANDLIVELNRINPSEILIPSKKGTKKDYQIVAEQIPDIEIDLSAKFSCTLFSKAYFAKEATESILKKAFNVNSLEAFGAEDYPLAIMAAGAVVTYLDQNHPQLPYFDVITPYNITKYVSIDAATRKNLELIRTVRDGSYEGSLLWALDRTKTPMGSRLIRQWLQQPLQELTEITYRLDSVEEFIENRDMATEIASILNDFKDIERISSRITNNTANPKEIVALKDSLVLLPNLSRLVGNGKSPYLQTLSYVPDALDQAVSAIDACLKDEPSSSLRDGNIIREGYNSELDEYRSLLNGGLDWISNYEKEEKDRTGIKSLKVNYNKTFGYYIEVTNANASLVPETYIRKQTLTNAERYITQELKEYESKVLTAQSKLTDLEYRLFVELRDSLKSIVPTVKAVSKALSIVDVLISFAEVSIDQGYCKPYVDNSGCLLIKDGRHPVIEKMLPMGCYVPNDLDLCSSLGNADSKQIMVLTGPNMAGKSTYMRQTALIALMAQVGCFVPASEARIGIVDKIFTRVGAVDDLATGQSTFMVEMNETAYILNAATDKSLILLDEIGRGTSTFDGVAIAWSVTEYIAEQVRARTIFATHYHELNVLEKNYPQVVNCRVTVNDNEGKIEFLHKVVPGGASRSYGIHVAEMAGLPNCVIDRAQTLMDKLVKDDSATINTKKRSTLKVDLESPQLSLFS